VANFVNEFAWFYKRRGARADTPFTPDQLSGIAWFDPRAGVFVERSSPTTPSTDGQPVGTWEAVTGEVAVAPSDAARPTYRANGGKPYLEFDGTNDTLVTLDIDVTYEYAAGMRLAGTTATNYGGVFDCVDDTGGLGPRYAVFNQGASTHFNTPRAVYKDDAALSAPFDIAPANVFMVYGVRVADAHKDVVDASGRGIAQMGSTYYLACRVADLILSPADFTVGEQDQVWNFIAGRL
jgi:uncharacterized MAPEG superfamily protein